MNNQISSKQAGILLCISTFSSKLLLLPSILYSQAKNQAFLLLITIFFVEFLGVWFILKLKQKFYPLGLFEILKNIFGKIITKIIFGIFAFYFALKFLYVFLESYNYLKEMVNEDATILLYACCTLPVVNFLVLKGFRCLGRTAQFYFGFIVVGILSCFLIGFLAGAVRMPELEFGFKFVPKIFNVLFWFGDYGFLLLMFDKINPEKNLNKIVIKYFLLGIALVFCVHIMYFALFGDTTFMHFFAISDIVQFNIFFGGLWKLDILALLTIMFLLYFSMSLFMFCFSDCLSKICPSLNRTHSVVIIDIATFIALYLSVLNLEMLVAGATRYFKYLSAFCLGLIPLILLVSFFANKNKGVKYENIFE